MAGEDRAVKTPVASVSDALDIQDQRTGDLIQKLEELKSVLRPVLRPLVSNEVPGGMEGKPEPVEKRVYSRIADNTGRVALANSMIAELLDRVEL